VRGQGRHHVTSVASTRIQKSISKTVFLMVDLSGIVLAAHDGHREA